MSDRKLAKAVQILFREIGKIYRSMSKAFVTWLLRTTLILNRKKVRTQVAGFVLPTTVFLILVVGLTAGALTYRAFNSSTRAINETQNRVIYNAATPAVDRARAKLEFLFDANKDSRYPGGVPSEEFLASMLLNSDTGVTVKGRKATPLRIAGSDPYTLPDETRIDINGGAVDNAWRYRADTNNDGVADATVVYSIIFSTPADEPGKRGWQKLIELTDEQKARPSVKEPNSDDIISFARTGPLSNNKAKTCSVSTAGTGSSVEGGWYQDVTNTSILRKNFQVDALVIPDSIGRPGATNNFTTLEFNQDRILSRGNKWGAWFRNDLEIFPGPAFQWNGAMHTEGSLIVGNNSFSAYLISAPNSCFWYESASEVTVTDINNATTGERFQGQVISGRMNNNAFGDGSLFYIYSDNFNLNSKANLNSTSDSVTSGSPFSLSLDSSTLQLSNGYKSRSSSDPSNTATGLRNTGYNSSTLAKRIFNKSEAAPYVDDTYRADDRYGPKQKYSDKIRIPSGKNSGDQILAGDNVAVDTSQPIEAGASLIASNPTAGSDASSVGLDGYWERRARIQGLRLLVGERLELGNANGWVAPQDRPNNNPQDLTATTVTPGDGNFTTLREGSFPNNPASLYKTTRYKTTTDFAEAELFTSDNEGDPLYPPHSETNMTHEQRQRRALRDNLSAVQGMAIYHGAVNKDYPIACYANTAHHGSPFTLRQSINFVPTLYVNSAPATVSFEPSGGLNSTSDAVLLNDFFLGRGTNGWEYEPPSRTQAQFEADMANASSPLRVALKNLAQFAGDHISDSRTGAFPPSQIDGEVHPDPELSMWGNFSNLRRVIAKLEGGTAYASLSIADKTYLQTASCTLGMLAYNIDRVQRYDPRNPLNDRAVSGVPAVAFFLTNDILRLMNGVVDEANNDYEVLPAPRLATYNYSPNANLDIRRYNPRDYDTVTAEAFLGKLREYYIARGVSPNDPRLRLAELIFTHFQVQRDRTYGFRPSPAANTWNYNPFVVPALFGGVPVTTWSSACDPNLFAFGNITGPQGALTANADAIRAAFGYGGRDLLLASRLALSRLCGTVIPPGGVHDRPGDVGYPARSPFNNQPNGRPTAANAASSGVEFRYLPTGRNPASPDTRLTPYVSPNDLDWSVSTDDFKDNNSINNTNASNPLTKRYPYIGAMVAPKWPSLFYIFPEYDHDHLGNAVNAAGAKVTPSGVLDLTGTAINDGDENAIDFRQPTGDLRDPRTDKAIPVAFQPWAEPYINDTYVRAANSTAVYKVVDPVAPTMSNLRGSETSAMPGYSTEGGAELSFTDPSTPGSVFRFHYKTFGSPLKDSPVYSVALRPRKLPTSSTSGIGSGFNVPFPMVDYPQWELPVSTLPNSLDRQNVPSNRILAPAGTNTTGVVGVVPFLDRVLFNGREGLPARVLDLDVGMLRRTRPNNQDATLSDSYAPNDVWLPVSGITYAFREDAVREDAINRPKAASSLPAAPNPPQQTDVRNASTLGVDPPLGPQNISVKAVDFVADPDRRPHGFRLRNATILKRHNSMSIPIIDNVRGISLFTDNPVYIMGNFNLHQRLGVNSPHTSGNGEDALDPYNESTRIEEFAEKLPSTAGYNETQFYVDRVTTDSDFAEPTIDLWRPSEILADGISILSDTFCDGSALDTFMTAGTGNTASIAAGSATYSGRNTTESGTAFPNSFYPYPTPTSGGQGGAGVYNNTLTGLFGSGLATNGVAGCRAGGRTSFLNQNRPSTVLPNSGTSALWRWARENPDDFFSPIKISRNGNGLVQRVSVNTDPISKTSTPGNTYIPVPPRMTGSYTSAPLSGAYYDIKQTGTSATNGRPNQAAQDTRVNSIIVSGITPSRQGQSYGGMHNFPRFLEDWTRLWFSGSFLQLSFSNYATAPFDLQATEPGVTPQNNGINAERISYYAPPNRLWGYDVALQKAPAGPAAARFVTATKERNEFYKELPVTDPYIKNLCLAAQTTVTNLKCP